MSRRIGNRIVQCCTEIAKYEIASHVVIALAHPDMKTSDIRKYCDKAVVLGLMRVNRDETPKRYSVIEGWMDRLCNKSVDKKYRIAAGKKPVSDYRPIKNRVNSVWQLGGVL